MRKTRRGDKSACPVSSVPLEALNRHRCRLTAAHAARHEHRDHAKNQTAAWEADGEVQRSVPPASAQSGRCADSADGHPLAAANALDLNVRVHPLLYVRVRHCVVTLKPTEATAGGGDHAFGVPAGKRQVPRCPSHDSLRRLQDRFGMEPIVAVRN